MPPGPPGPAGQGATKGVAWKYATIRSADVKFTREVALAVYGKRSVPVWYFYVPFMFLLEAIRKGSFIRTFLQASTLPQELAINAALELNRGEDKVTLLLRIEEPIRKWLSDLGIDTPGLFQKQMEEIGLQLEHYSRLLKADGDTYHALVKGAYTNREQYEVFLSQLHSVGRDACREVVAILGDNKELAKRVQLTQQQSEKLREQEASGIFSQ